MSNACSSHSSLSIDGISHIDGVSHCDSNKYLEEADIFTTEPASARSHQANDEHQEESDHQNAPSDQKRNTEVGIVRKNPSDILSSGPVESIQLLGKTITLTSRPQQNGEVGTW